ncbi:unnamed protein product [Echinostoma caproni]|uniref:DeoRC domain-containing protein n=1 Tax=Echinostoma caproni TaxID=27848 RepID=A0A183AUK9_9TREM|nr:unnamed protein product [Echinostoma caproni]
MCMRVLHSRHLFTHRGPVLIVLQAGGVSYAGVWANRLLLHPQHGLKTGSQLDLIRQAHSRGFAVALIHTNEQIVPREAEIGAIDLVSTLYSTGSAADTLLGRSKRVGTHNPTNTVITQAMEPDSIPSHSCQIPHSMNAAGLSTPTIATPAVAGAQCGPPIQSR